MPDDRLIYISVGNEKNKTSIPLRYTYISP